MSAPTRPASALIERREAAIIEAGWRDHWDIPEWPCGHPRSPENTQRVGVANGVRCRICRRRIGKTHDDKRGGKK